MNTVGDVHCRKCCLWRPKHEDVYRVWWYCVSSRSTRVQGTTIAIYSITSLGVEQIFLFSLEQKRSADCACFHFLIRCTGKRAVNVVGQYSTVQYRTGVQSRSVEIALTVGSSRAGYALKRSKQSTVQPSL